MHHTHPIGPVTRHPVTPQISQPQVNNTHQVASATLKPISYEEARQELTIVTNVYGLAANRDILYRLYATRQFALDSYSFFIDLRKIKCIMSEKESDGSKAGGIAVLSFFRDGNSNELCVKYRDSSKPPKSINDFFSGTLITEKEISGAEYKSLSFVEAKERGLEFDLVDINEEDSQKLLSQPCYKEASWFFRADCEDPQTIVFVFKDYKHVIQQYPHKILCDEEGNLYFQRLGCNNYGEKNELIPAAHFLKRYDSYKTCLVDPYALNAISSTDFLKKFADYPVFTEPQDEKVATFALLDDSFPVNSYFIAMEGEDITLYQKTEKHCVIKEKITFCCDRSGTYCHVGCRIPLASIESYFSSLLAVRLDDLQDVKGKIAKQLAQEESELQAAEGNKEKLTRLLENTQYEKKELSRAKELNRPKILYLEGRLVKIKEALERDRWAKRDW